MKTRSHTNKCLSQDKGKNKSLVSSKDKCTSFITGRAKKNETKNNCKQVSFAKINDEYLSKNIETNSYCLECNTTVSPIKYDGEISSIISTNHGNSISTVKLDESMSCSELRKDIDSISYDEHANSVTFVELDSTVQGLSPIILSPDTSEYSLSKSKILNILANLVPTRTQYVPTPRLQNERVSLSIGLGEG